MHQPAGGTTLRISCSAEVTVAVCAANVNERRVDALVQGKVEAKTTGQHGASIFLQSADEPVADAKAIADAGHVDTPAFIALESAGR